MSQISMLDTIAQPPARALARLRHGRALHRDGLTRVGASLVDTDDLPIGPGPVTVRVSKGIGTPGGLPDLVGIAIRFEPEAHLVAGGAGRWDLLMTGDLRRIAGVEVPVPAHNWSGITVSPLTRFQYRGSTWRLSGLLDTPPSSSGLDIGELADILATDNAVVTLTASRDGGPWQSLGTVEFGAVREEDDVTFDPTDTLPRGVDPVPDWLNRLRRSAYRGSRQGRQ
ncbi:hypothetical protein [Gordonia malaquae]|uniref:hypothetical protein n=1 Tax=Gordonia malaquae TaxID=410332 RepID=UPI0030FED0DD